MPALGSPDSENRPCPWNFPVGYNGRDGQAKPGVGSRWWAPAWTPRCEGHRQPASSKLQQPETECFVSTGTPKFRNLLVQVVWWQTLKCVWPDCGSCCSAWCWGFQRQEVGCILFLGSFMAECRHQAGDLIDLLSPHITHRPNRLNIEPEICRRPHKSMIW